MSLYEAWEEYCDEIETAEQKLQAAVTEAHKTMSWQEIGNELGMTRQSAWKRFRLEVGHESIARVKGSFR